MKYCLVLDKPDSQLNFSPDAEICIKRMRIRDRGAQRYTAATKHTWRQGGLTSRETPPEEGLQIAAQVEVVQAKEAANKPQYVGNKQTGHFCA